MEKDFGTSPVHVELNEDETIKAISDGRAMPLVEAYFKDPIIRKAYLERVKRLVNDAGEDDKKLLRDLTNELSVFLRELDKVPAKLEDERARGIELLSKISLNLKMINSPLLIVAGLHMINEGKITLGSLVGLTIAGLVFGAEKITEETKHQLQTKSTKIELILQKYIKQLENAARKPETP